MLEQVFGLTAVSALSAAVAVVLVVLTAGQLVLGELVPKTLALQYPTGTALATVLPMEWSLVLFRPLLTVLNGSALILLRRLGAGDHGHQHLHSPEEIDLLIAESRDGGLLEPEEQQRLRRALHLNRRTAADLMVPSDRLTMIEAGASWNDVLQTVLGSSFSRLPVFRGSRDQIVGIVRVKEMVERHATTGAASVDVLMRAPLQIDASLSADQVLATLRATPGPLGRRRRHGTPCARPDHHPGRLDRAAGDGRTSRISLDDPAGRSDLVTLTGIVVASLAFVLLNALFVAAEFALIGASRMTLERMSGGGDRLARHVLRVVSTPRRQDRYLATAQLGITLASLGLGMFGEHALATYLVDHVAALAAIGGAAAATLLSLCLLTVAHIVIGEMLPKGLALQNPVGVAKLAHWPMYVSLLLFYPFVVVLNGFANLSLRLVGVRRQQNTHEQIYSPEELQLIVEESEKGGTLQAESGRLLQELFEFGDLTASHAMVPRVRVIGIPVGTGPDELRVIAQTHRRTRYPVYEHDLDQIIGMVHVKDLLQCILRGEAVTAARTRRMPVVPETATLDVVLETMQQAHAHLALVVDEHGGTAGIISLEDLFEEVVGELDEGSPSAPETTKETDGSLRVAGTLRLEELGQQFDLELEHEDVESVSGLVLALLDRLPTVGDAVQYGRIRLEVTAMSGRGVGKLGSGCSATEAEDVSYRH